ncbi:hypothetical protein E2C01_068370 [Portunus trituberculatus]|uniref:Uncharacterized protein n=1 Tax=Portunus trituberculatus TaxID=210409 RepID=A0A5B7HW10_PORTR|nr:hypothetical protein [Portunus trituberculatus]
MNTELIRILAPSTSSETYHHPRQVPAPPITIPDPLTTRHYPHHHYQTPCHHHQTLPTPVKPITTHTKSLLPLSPLQMPPQHVTSSTITIRPPPTIIRPY